MYVVILIILMITSFTIGYKSSVNRLKADDVDWLKNRLFELGHPFPEVVTKETEPTDKESTSIKKHSGKKSTSTELEDIVKQQKAQIRAAFFNALKTNLAKGAYDFDHYHDAYSILPKPATMTCLSESIREFTEANPSLKINGTLLYSEYRGKYYIHMKVSIV